MKVRKNQEFSGGWMKCSKVSCIYKHILMTCDLLLIKGDWNNHIGLYKFGHGILSYTTKCERKYILYYYITLV